MTFITVLWYTNKDIASPPPNTYVMHSIQIMTSMTITLEKLQQELLDIPKQELHTIMIALQSLVKGCGMISQIILNFVHFI